jgi:hypothetical protein
MKWFGPKRKKTLPDCCGMHAEICELSVVVTGRGGHVLTKIFYKIKKMKDFFGLETLHGKSNL